MAKLMGNLRIATNPGTDQNRPYFEVTFVPYAGRVNSQPVRVDTHDDLVQFLMKIKLSEDDASRWAGRARSEGVILIPSIERTESQLKDSGLLA